MNNYLIILLISHVLGDFYFQNEKMASDKDYKYKSLLAHMFIYSIGMVIPSLIFQNKNAFIGALIASLAHLVIDHIKFKLYQIEKKHIGKRYTWIKKASNTGKLFVIDQGLHLISLVLINVFFLQGIHSYDGLSFIGLTELDENLVLRVFLVVLLLLKPVNITFRKIFGQIKPIMEEEINFTGQRSAGRIVGNLERMLIFILLLVNQYSAIGLVFTAKSITRYNKIVEDKKFGEYYLVGTLYSLLATVILYLIFIKIKY